MKIKAFKRLISLMLSALIIFAFASPAFAKIKQEVLTVGVPTDRCPIFYIDSETNEITGIGADLMRFAAYGAGYDVVFKEITEGSLTKALDNEEYDVIMPFASAIKSEAGKSIVLSDNLFQTPFTLVSEGKKELPPFTALKVGMLESQSGVAKTLRNRFPGMAVIMYPDMASCIKALRKNEVDALLQNSYVWNQVLQKPSYSNLVMHPSAMFSMDFRVAARESKKGREIINRLNGGISWITESRRSAITLDYSSRKLYKYTFADYLYQYRIIIIMGALLLAAFIIIAVQKRLAIKRKQEEEIQQLLDHDPLTGILSMDGFRKKVKELLKENPNAPYFLSYNNIRDFKYINDSMGREAGDELLKFWAKKSMENLSDDEAIGRITADRFAVLRSITNEENMRSDEMNVFAPVNNFFINRGKDIKVQICSGIYVLTPEDYVNIDVDHMLDMASVAESKIRQSRKENFAFYNPEQWQKGKQIADIINYLPSAIESGDIKVYYQPQVNYKTNEITGAEVLCRWEHSKLGWLIPSEFIPVLESTGLIINLDKYIWETVCKDLGRWNDMGIHRSASVNVSRSDIRENQSITEVFKNLIKKYNLSPDQLNIEITETAFVERPELLINTAKSLRAAGFSVEMDDFGSGYSSLNMLKDVPVDRIKLDFRFLTQSEDSEKSRIIISCVVDMVKKLGLELISEGVETTDQAEFLSSLGANEMQGYYFYKPMPTEEFEKLIF